MTDRLKHLTSRTPEQWASLSAAQSRVLRAMSDHAPGGHLRFTVDLAKGTVDVEEGEGEPCPES